MNKNDPHAQFELSTNLFKGMSGDASFFQNGVQGILDDDTTIRHGICIPIAAAIYDARDHFNGTNGDVSTEIEHIIKQLTIFKNNLDGPQLHNI